MLKKLVRKRSKVRKAFVITWTEIKKNEVEQASFLFQKEESEEAFQCPVSHQKETHDSSIVQRIATEVQRTQYAYSKR